jgi:hypothetical protein
MDFTEAELNNLAKRLLWVLILLGILMFVMGCGRGRAPSAQTCKEAVTLEQFRILSEEKVFAQHLRLGSTVELTFPSGCIVTVPAHLAKQEGAPRVRVLSHKGGNDGYSED